MTIVYILGALAWADAGPTPPVGEIAVPSRESVRERLCPPTPAFDAEAALTAAMLDAVWESEASTLDAAVATIAARRPEARALFADASVDVVVGAGLADRLRQMSEDPFVRAALATAIGRDLARRDLVEEALALLESAPTTDLVDPATYYFYRALCEHRLQKRDAALQSLDALGKVAAVPQRYENVATAMRAALDGLKRESLDGIAHDMRDIERRLELGRSHAPVQDLEKDVLARLDKIIEQLEQQQQQQQGGGGASSSTTPDQPAGDSRVLGGAGPGEVDPKSFKKHDPWGNLPPKQRERALQHIGRQFPAHYGPAIEAYYKKLATSKARN